MTRDGAMVDVRRKVRSAQSLRHGVRSGLDRVAAATGVLSICERRMRRGLTILMYHRVLPAELCRGYPLQALPIPVNVFEQQMRWLAASCQVLPVREAMEALEQSAVRDRPLVSITFDDGYADNVEAAAPILEELDMRATFFITTSFVEHGGPLWFDRAADAWKRCADGDRLSLLSQLSQHGQTPGHGGRNGHGLSSWMEGLKRTAPDIRDGIIAVAEHAARGEIVGDAYRPMPREQIVQLHQRGHEIGAHTVTHPILTHLSDDNVRAELTNSAAWLRESIGGDIAGFCYPNGDTDGRIEVAVAQAGYRYACTTKSGVNRLGTNPMRLMRLPITMQRTVRGAHQHDAIGFRAELCRLREWWR